MPRFKRGDLLSVVDLDNWKGAKKPPFAKGAKVTCKDVRPGYVGLVEHPGWFKAERFGARDNG